ncbi:hypothetical protein KI387_007207, partial [Taxus chinensis]
LIFDQGATTVRTPVEWHRRRPTQSYYSDSNVVERYRHSEATGDGVTDDTKAFSGGVASSLRKGSTTLHVPTGYRFLVAPVNFSGPCHQNIFFK